MPPASVAAGGEITMRTSTLVPDPTVVALEEIVTEADRITLVIRADRPAVCCPACAQVARRVHSRYIRRPDDLPWQGLAVRLCQISGGGAGGTGLHLVALHG